MKLIFILILGISATFAENPVPFSKIVQEAALKTDINLIRADASEWCDLFLSNVRQLILQLGLDRVLLPEIYHAFEKEVLFINWQGEFWMHDGWLRGLETIRRTGIAELHYENGEIVIAFEGGCTNPTLAYDGMAKFMGLGPHMTVRGSVSQVRVGFRIRFTLTPEVSIVLEKLDVTDTGSLSLDIKGLGIIFNYISEIIVGTVGNLVKDFVVNIFIGPVTDVINTVLAQLTDGPIPEFVQNIEKVREILTHEPRVRPSQMQIKMPKIA